MTNSKKPEDDSDPFSDALDELLKPIERLGEGIDKAIREFGEELDEVLSDYETKQHTPSAEPSKPKETPPKDFDPKAYGFRTGEFSAKDAFETLSGRYRAAPPRASLNQIRHDALVRDFARGIAERDRRMLQDAVHIYSDEVHSLGTQSLLRFHGYAATFVREPHLAIKSLSRLDKPLFQESAVIGLFLHENGTHPAAARHLHKAYINAPRSEDIPQVPPAVAVALSSSNYQRGKKEREFHHSILKPHLERSADANIALGVVFHNAGVPQGAEYFFQGALNLAPFSEKAMLGSLASRRLQGREVESELPAFYAQTGSSLMPEELLAIVNGREIAMPNFPTDRPYDLLPQLRLK